MSSGFDRRPVLKALGFGASFGLLPKAWTRPIVHSIVVPAHAAASPSTTTTTGTTSSTTAEPCVIKPGQANPAC
jgi:hypothetical protein